MASALAIILQNCLPKESVKNKSPLDYYKILENSPTLYVHAILRAEVDGKLYAMSDYFTTMHESREWLSTKNKAHNPIKRMKESSQMFIFHQDEFLIEKTLEEISKIFATAVTWNKETQKLQELKDTMALFCYLSAHNIRDVRGSAAETEWLEQAIYRSLEIEFPPQKRKMVDLEAFANPLFSDFRKVYDEMTAIKISSSNE